MDNQNQQIGIPTSPYKKSKKKLIIAAVAGTVLLVTIVLGTTTSFMGSMQGALNQSKNDGTKTLNPNIVKTLDAGTATTTNTPAAATLNITGTLKTITDTTILAEKHVYVDSFNIEQDADGNYTSYTANICTSQDSQDDLEVNIYLNTSDLGYPSLSISDTIDIPAGNCDYENFLITYDFASGTTYTSTIEIYPTTTDTIAADNTKEVEFTTPREVASVTAGPIIIQNLGLTEDDEMQVAEVKIVDVGSLASAALNKDDIYIKDVTVNDDHSFIYVTVVSTETNLSQLYVLVEATKGSSPMEERYFDTDIEAGSDSAVELSISMDNFTETELTTGVYTITATIAPNEDQQTHNEVSSNDSKEISFTIFNTEPVATGVYDISVLEDDNENETNAVANGTTYINPKDDDETLVATETPYLDTEAEDDNENETNAVANGTTYINPKDDDETLVATDTPYLNTEAEDDTGAKITYDANTLLTDLQQNLETNAAEADDTASEQKFTDIPGTWYEDSVTRLSDLGIVSGYPDGTFGGSKAMNRAEITKIVVEGFGYPIYTDCGITFSDVTDTTAWYYDYVYTAACYGIVNGYSDTNTFEPENELNRAEALKVTMAASLIEEIAPHVLGNADVWGENPYDDVKSYHWFYTYVMEAYYGDIITAPSDNMYRPGSTINRAEVVTLIDKIITILSEQEPTI